MNRDFKKKLKEFWYFIWEDDSVLSWVVNIVLAFVLIKFIVYPSLGFMLTTSHPVVAVVSESMEHSINQDYNKIYRLCDETFKEKERVNLDKYWESCGSWYVTNFGIKKDQFEEYPFKNGFNKGDIMVLKGVDHSVANLGEVIVFTSNKPDPIIHRVVRQWQSDKQTFYHTKGDHNKGSIQEPGKIDETRIHQDQVIGKAVFRIPYLGYIKIWFTQAVCIGQVSNTISKLYPIRC